MIWMPGRRVMFIGGASMDTPAKTTDWKTLADKYCLPCNASSDTKKES